MKILLVAPRYLPIFNKNDEGAIEKLERIYLKYNESTEEKITVYSPKIASDNYDDPNLKNSVFRNIDQTSKKYKLSKYIGAILKRIKRSSNNECYIRAVAKDIIKRKEQNLYDLIIFENGEQDIPIFRKLTKTSTKIVLHLHNDYVNTETKGGLEIVKSCDEIWAVSNYIARRVEEVAPIKTVIISNTIEKSIKRAKSNSVKDLKNKYDTDNNIIFLYIGRLLETKGIFQLLEAFDRFNKTSNKCKLIIIGKTEGDKKGKRLLSKVNNSCSKNNNIISIGYIRPEKLPNYQAIADCQVVPSMSNEAFGLVVLEAMRANLKIIASRSGGIPEIGKDKIMYVDRKNIVKNLEKKFSEVTKIKLPNDYYSEILNEYTEEKYCKKMHNAIKGSKK